MMQCICGKQMKLIRIDRSNFEKSTYKCQCGNWREVFKTKEVKT